MALGSALIQLVMVLHGEYDTCSCRCTAAVLPLCLLNWEHIPNCTEAIAGLCPDPEDKHTDSNEATSPSAVYCTPSQSDDRDNHLNFLLQLLTSHALCLLFVLPGQVDNWVYDEANNTFIEDEAMAARMMEMNPNSFRKLVATFLEANGRGYWEAKPEQLERLRQLYMDVEDKIEGVE